LVVVIVVVPWTKRFGKKKKKQRKAKAKKGKAKRKWHPLVVCGSYMHLLPGEAKARKQLGF
jgi:hypothetical protein